MRRPSDGAQDDNFGWSVAVSEDAAVIGARSASVGGHARQGAAYVFADTNGSGWSQRKKLVADDGGAGDEFGYRVAIRGKNIVIGEHKGGVEIGQGRAYLFTREAGSWNKKDTLTASDGAAGDNFGISVAVDGNTTLVGQRDAYSPGNPRSSAVYFYGANDLDFSISVPDSVTVGEQYTSQAIVTNNANEDSPSAITAIMPVPAGTHFVSANTTQGGCSGSGSSVICALGTIPGNAGRVTANVMLEATGSVGDTINNSASLAGATPAFSRSESTEIKSTTDDDGGGSTGAGSGSSGGGSLSLFFLMVSLMLTWCRCRKR